MEQLSSENPLQAEPTAKEEYGTFQKFTTALEVAAINCLRDALRMLNSLRLAESGKFMRNFISKTKPVTLLYFSFWIIYFTVFWLHAFSTDAAGNIKAGLLGLWADWAMHFTLGSTMAYRDLAPTISPLVLGEPFSYPFATAWISALLIKLGVPFIAAFVVPSWLSSLFFIFALYYFYNTVLPSKGVAVLAACLFFLNGGLGFIVFIQDLFSAAEPLTTILNPPKDYTNLPEQGIKWISVVSSMIIPQRALTLGFPLTLLALSWIFRNINGQTASLTPLVKRQRLSLLGASILLGLMPIIHTHSFLAAFMIIACWCSFDLYKYRHVGFSVRLKTWLAVALITSLLALPLIVLFIFNSATQGFIQWNPGWYAPEYQQNWFWFWLNNWSVTPFLAIIGFLGWLWSDFKKRQCSLSVQAFTPFWLIFLLSNLWQFQPWLWDNTKLFIWASIGLSGMAASFLSRLWESHRFTVTNRPLNSIIIRKVSVIVLLIAATFSGALDCYRTTRISLHNYVMYTAEELELARWVKIHTTASSLWLTSDKHNHWLFNLTGRQAVMTYPGWLWTHGYEYSVQAKDIETIYRSADRSLIEQYGIDYIVLGPETQRKWSTDPNRFKVRFELTKKTANYFIFKI